MSISCHYQNTTIGTVIDVTINKFFEKKQAILMETTEKWVDGEINMSVEVYRCPNCGNNTFNAGYDWGHRNEALKCTKCGNIISPLGLM